MPITKFRISAHMLHIETGDTKDMIIMYVDTKIPQERNVHALFVLMKLKMYTILFLNMRKIRL